MNPTLTSKPSYMVQSRCMSDQCTWPWGHYILFDLGEAPTPRLAVIIVKEVPAHIDKWRSLSKKYTPASADIKRMGLRNKEM
ncbi:hypothetical protein TNCV_42471 [Trichonephila clavipes]|nr:hypothetical protein TNCV_42471 [Trichonephila clavipes]